MSRQNRLTANGDGGATRSASSIMAATRRLMSENCMGCRGSEIDPRGLTPGGWAIIGARPIESVNGRDHCAAGAHGRRNTRLAGTLQNLLILHLLMLRDELRWPLTGQSRPAR